MPWQRSVQQRLDVSVVSPQALGNFDHDLSLLIRWGTRRGADHHARRVINRKQALAIAYDQAESAQRLRMSGLNLLTRRKASAMPGRRLFRVEVFDLQPLMVRRLVLDGGRWRLQSTQGASARTLQRAMSAAVRGLHALGLDSGRVDVALLPIANGVPREAVCAVNPAPDWPEMLAAAVAKRIPVSAWEQVPAEPWLFGADPEFIFFDQERGQLVPASRFLPRRGRVGCDAQTDPQDPTARILAELRPPPRHDPLQLVQDIKRCLALVVRRNPDRRLQWRAGSYPAQCAVGGHIHFSRQPLDGALLRALDSYLAVPVMLVEPSAAAMRRRRRHGFLGDVRFKAHGGFEYRTLPSWLVSPTMARAVLALAAWVAGSYRTLAHDLFLDTSALDAFYAADKSVFYPLCGQLIDDLSRQRDAERYLPAVAPLLDLIDRRQEWQDAADIRRTWQIKWPAAAAARQGSLA